MSSIPPASDRSSRRADAVIVGCGVIGASIAYHLAIEGVRVVVLDKQTPGGGASSANPGAVSIVSKKPGLQLDLAMRSLLRFDVLASELGEDIEFDRCGALVLADTETELEFLTSLVHDQRAAGADVRLIAPEQVATLAPGIAGPVVGAAYAPSDAQVNPMRLTQALVAAAEAHGAKVLPLVAASEIHTSNGRVSGVRTDSGFVAADWIINAAGVDANDIGMMVGVNHEVRPIRGQLLVLAASEGLPSMRIASTRQLLAKHRSDPASGRLSFGYTPKPRSGTLILGGTNEDVGQDVRTTAEGLQWIAASGVRRLPALANLPVIRAWAGLRPHRVGGPLIGPAGGPPGYLAAVGHGGDGVALSPITGALISGLVCHGSPGVIRESAHAVDWVSE